MGLNPGYLLKSFLLYNKFLWLTLFLPKKSGKNLIDFDPWSKKFHDHTKVSSYYLVIPGRLLETYEQFLLFLLLKHLRSALIFPSYWIPKRSRFQPCLDIWSWKMFRFQPCLDFWPIVCYWITQRSRFQPCLNFWPTKWPRFQPCLDFWSIVLNIKPGILVMACLWRNVLMLLNSSKDKVKK